MPDGLTHWASHSLTRPSCPAVSASFAIRRHSDPRHSAAVRVRLLGVVEGGGPHQRGISLGRIRMAGSVDAQQAREFNIPVG